MIKKSKNKIKDKKILLLLLVVLLLAAGGFAYSQQRKSNSSSTPTQNTNPAETINLEPATEEDKQRAEQNKKAIEEKERQLQNQPPPTSGKKAVKPIITYASQYGQTVEVGGYINGIFEEGGTCTAVFSQGDSSFSKQTGAVRNATAVDCPVLKAESSEFASKGLWQVTLSYDSSLSSGSSDPGKVEVK